jgi:hypothetical protein
MVYNSAEMLGIPWETAIKTYRKQLSKGHHPHLEDYAIDFLKFIDSHSGLYPSKQKEKLGEEEITAFFLGIRETFYVELQKVFTGQRKREIDDSEIQAKRLLTIIIEANYRKAKTMPVFEHENGTKWSKELIRKIEKTYVPRIRKIRTNVFTGIPLDSHHKRLLMGMAKLSLTGPLARQATPE